MQEGIRHPMRLFLGDIMLMTISFRWVVMQKKKALWLVGLSVMLWFPACESPVSTSVKSGDLTRTEYAVYTSENKIYDPAWSPDVESIAWIQRDGLYKSYSLSIALIFEKLP